MTTPDKINTFWRDLYAALQRRAIPMALRTDRAADVGWGLGVRLLIDSRNCIIDPSQWLFRPLDEVTAEGIADAVQAAYRLTRRERQVLGAIRDGAVTHRYRQSKMAQVGEETVRESTLERLVLLGLVKENDIGNGSDSEYVAVQPESVHR